MGIKGCWTCRARKVRCDLQRPSCGNCIKARRSCQGYGIQLSWPRDGDRKRAQAFGKAHCDLDTSSLNVKGFLNTSSCDVSLSMELEGHRRPAHHIRNMRIPRPTYLSPTATNSKESHLLGFFYESRSLILGPTDEEVLAQFILRIAFSDPSDSTNPVLQGVFALASLQLHGNSKSLHYKSLVLSSVKESVDLVDEKTLLQNLIARMLLYHYELSLESNSKGSWVQFLCAIKTIMNTSPTIHKLLRQEYSDFLDWMYYHKTIAEFTIRHWQVPYESCSWEPRTMSRKAATGNHMKVYNSIGCPSDVLELIIRTCRRAIVTKPPGINYASIDPERTQVLEKNISTTLGDTGPIHVLSSTTLNRNIMVSDLHRLACLIYVNRVAHCVSGTEFGHRRLVREGILLLTKMKTCQTAWPLFIIACEADNDDQRLAILDVFEQSRQDRRRRSSHINFIQHLVEAMWNQHDLDAEKQLNYLTIFDTVIRGVPFVPPFA